MTHDARREFYVTAITILENAQLSFSLLRDQLVDLSWWESKVGAVSDAKRMSVMKEFALMVKWFTFHTLAMAVDETLGAVQRAAPNVFHIFGHPTLKKTYTKVLEVTGKQELKPFLDVLRETRNTIHTNGIYSQPGVNSRSYMVNGEEFKFEFGRILEWFHDQRLIWFADNIAVTMNTIIKSSEVSTINNCPRGFPRNSR